MMKYLHNLRIFILLVLRHLREQGLRTTLKWAYAVGVPYITGDLPLRYSRVTPQLYVGAQHGRRGLERLKDEGIDAIINLRDESDDAKHGLNLTGYSYIPVIDHTAPKLDDLDKGVAFIRETIAKGDKVYIHCHSGVGRAPTMAAAYLIAEGASVEEAVAQVTKARPFIRILPDQLKRLYDYKDYLQSDKLAQEENVTSTE
jgi:protein-tyrosine phosphatase